MRIHLPLAALAIAALAQCAPAQISPAPDPGGSGAACGADRLQGLIGQPWPQSLPIRPAELRVYATGDPVTMDHRPARLNIELDRQRRRVVAVGCG